MNVFMMDAESLLEKLRGGDQRSIGRADEMAREALDRPDLFGILIGGMLHADPLIRMRSADAAEKVSRTRPEWLEPHKRRLLTEITAQALAEIALRAPRLRPRVLPVVEELTRAGTPAMRSRGRKLLDRLAAQG